jgi:endonuclease III
MYNRKKPNVWIKITGTLGCSLKFKQTKPDLLIIEWAGKTERNSVKYITELETGLWHAPFEHFVDNLPFSDVMVKVAEQYPGVRIPIAPHDFNYIVIAVALSKRTSYERFVLNWCKKIWECYDGDLKAIADSSIEELKKIGSSYQILQLRKIVANLLQVKFGELLGLNPNITRLYLLSLCKLLGPKAVDSLILSTFRAPYFIPCDVHLFIVSSRLGLIDPEITTLPQKNFCIKYVCTKSISERVKVLPCPKAGSCLRAKLLWLGEIGGWFQTISYIHGSKICRTRKPLCNECGLKQVCQNPP